MDVKRIRFAAELKVGGQTWRKGSILEAPFPSVITTELRAIASGKVWPATIEVLERETTPPPKNKKEEEESEKKLDVEGTDNSEKKDSIVKTKKEKVKPPLRKQ